MIYYLILCQEEGKKKETKCYREFTDKCICFDCCDALLIQQDKPPGYKDNPIKKCFHLLCVEEPDLHRALTSTPSNPSVINWNIIWQPVVWSIIQCKQQKKTFQLAALLYFLPVWFEMEQYSQVKILSKSTAGYELNKTN